MKFKTQWLIGILGLTALISSPAVAQNTPLQDFFNGLPPYTGDDITQPLNPSGNRETSNDTNVRESTEDGTPATNRNLTEQNNNPNQSESQLQRNAVPMNQKPNQPGSIR